MITQSQVLAVLVLLDSLLLLTIHDPLTFQEKK